MFDQLTAVDTLLYLSIPLTSGLVGWFTNYLALKMTFYPIEFIGIRPIGWQGIIPSKTKKMAEKSVDLLTQKLLKMEEQFDKIDPDVVAEEMKPGLAEVSKKITNEVMVSQIPDVWDRTPESIKDTIYVAAETELPIVVREMMADIKANINELIDLKKLSVSILMKDKRLVNEIFLRCGKEEFKFIERSGFYFGFLFGFTQMVIFFFFKPWWLLPLFGLIVGYLTNWLAIKLIFDPKNPHKIGPLVIQGLFQKRQLEVAKEYSEIVASRILTTEGLFEYMVRGPGAEKLAVLLKEHVEKVVDNTAGVSKGIITLLSGEERMNIIKNIVFFRFQQELPISIRQVFGYAETALDLKNNLRTKMSALSPEEFEGFLRPAFQEDETTLILIGAFLGCLAGFAQYFILFS